mmetsp:Transcript_22394/g.47419  ORF Transcript_22394/g.47419 Transcript_22394/m.47419 type:complete len:322 (-) Transcript_22394:601-1566(-)
MQVEILPPDSGDDVFKTDGAVDHQHETGKPATGPETDIAGNSSVNAGSESLSNGIADTNAAEKQNDTAGMTAVGPESNEELKDNNAKGASMDVGVDDQEDRKDIVLATASTNNSDDPKIEFVDRRIAKRFRVLTTNREHLGTGGKVERIFFGTVEKLIPGNVELWRILYDDGDVDIMSRPKLFEALDYYDAKKQLDTSDSHKRISYEEEEEKAKKRSKNAKTKATPPKKAKKPKAKVARPCPVPIWEGVPDEELDGGWPDGWIKKTFARKNGASKGTSDRYWFSPKEKFKFRSMVQVKKFIRALKGAKGDEMKAKEDMGKL